MKNFKIFGIFSWVFVILTFSQMTMAQLPSSCTVPGNLVVSDANNPVTAQLDIESVSVAEPFFGDGSQKLAFTLKVQNLTPLPVASWNVIFTGPDMVVRFVQMSTLLGAPQYRYGTLTTFLGLPVFNYSGNIQGNFNNQGFITFYVDKSAVNNFSSGDVVSVSAKTYIRPLVDLIEVDNSPSANYSVVGNGNCTPYMFVQWGGNGDVPVTNDYNRNLTNDFAVWRPNTGIWYTRDSITSEVKAVQFGSGASGDIPLPGDYDNDGKGDFAVYRPSTGIAYILKTENNTTQLINIGTAEDIPLTGDFDGDRIDDVAVFRPENGMWTMRSSSDASMRSMQFGMPEDRPIVGDFDGDRKSDIGVFRPSNGVWYIALSADNSFKAVKYGIDSDTVVPADYDGDEKTDIAVWRPETGIWYVLRSSDNTSTGAQWGSSEDRVQPGDYNGNGRADYAVWRPENGFWYVYNN